jgi:hypothetical protein
MRKEATVCVRADTRVAARGALVADKDGVGQRLLAKMGWSEGRGLGAREDGIQSHVKVSLKNNQLGACCVCACMRWAAPPVVAHTPSAGIGAKRSTSDNWLENVTAFDQLLSQLNQTPPGTPPPPAPTSAAADAAPAPPAARIETKRNQLCVPPVLLSGVAPRSHGRDAGAGTASGCSTRTRGRITGRT